MRVSRECGYADAPDEHRSIPETRIGASLQAISLFLAGFRGAEVLALLWMKLNGFTYVRIGLEGGGFRGVFTATNCFEPFLYY